jgi:hypothetical protein
MNQIIAGASGLPIELDQSLFGENGDSPHVQLEFSDGSSTSEPAAFSKRNVVLGRFGSTRFESRCESHFYGAALG